MTRSFTLTAVADIDRELLGAGRLVCATCRSRATWLVRPAAPEEGPGVLRCDLHVSVIPAAIAPGNTAGLVAWAGTLLLMVVTIGYLGWHVARAMSGGAAP